MFEAHGDVAVSAEFPLLISSVSGPWNRELVNHWLQTIHPFAAEFASRGPWIGVGIINSSMLCTAEALEIHQQVARNMVVSFGAVGAVHVASKQVEGESMMQDVCSSMFEGLCPYAQFETLEEARIWARRCLAGHG